MKIQKVPKMVALFLTLAIPMGISLPVVAIAAEPEIVNPRVFIGNTEGTQAEALSVRAGYSLSDNGLGAPVVDLTPINGKFAFVTGGFTPAYLSQSETNTRTFQFTNTTGAAFTVKDISAEIVDSEFEGGASTHQVIKEGTSVLTAPQADVEVPAGATVPVSIVTADPYAAVIRTNGAGEITGVGATTDFTFTVNGKAYGFEEVIGIGSASAATFLDASQSDMALFPECIDPNTGQQTLTLCATLAGASVSMTGLFLDEQAPTIPNDVTLEDENGNPVDGSTPVVTTPAPATGTPNGDGLGSGISDFCKSLNGALVLGFLIGILIIIIAVFAAIASKFRRDNLKIELNPLDEYTTRVGGFQLMNEQLGDNHVENLDDTEFAPIPTKTAPAFPITKKEEN